MCPRDGRVVSSASGLDVVGVVFGWAWPWLYWSSPGFPQLTGYFFLINGLGKAFACVSKKIAVVMIC